RLVVAIAEEQTEVVRLGVCGDVVDERRAGWSFGIEPAQLVDKRMPFPKYARGLPAEGDEVPLVLDVEPLHRNAIDPLLRRPRLVTPREVIARIRGQHVHFR